MLLTHIFMNSARWLEWCRNVYHVYDQCFSGPCFFAHVYDRCLYIEKKKKLQCFGTMKMLINDLGQSRQIAVKKSQNRNKYAVETTAKVSQNVAIMH